MVRGQPGRESRFPQTPGVRMPALRTLLALLILTPAVLAQKPEMTTGATVELYVVTLSDDGFAKLTLDYPNLAEKGVPNKTPLFLTRDDLMGAMEILQSRRSARFMKSPKLELASGRTGKLSCGQEIKFVTDLEVKTVNGKAESSPKTETIIAGLTATVCPTVSADRSRISLKLDVKNTTFDRNVALFPVTTFIEPVFEGGSKGVPVPLTQFVQRPVIEVVRADTTVDLANQSSAMQYLGKQVVPYDRESTRTMFAEIPYVNRLFKTTSTNAETPAI